MKKIIIVFLLFCYVVPALGLPVTAHYCCGKLASISVVFNTNPVCECGKRPMKKSCCKNKITTLKLKESQNLSKRVEFSTVQSIKFIKAIFSVTNLNDLNITFEKQFFYLHPPALQKNEALFLLHGVFLI